MFINVKKEIDGLYYIKTRYGKGGMGGTTPNKTFVRIPVYKDKKVVGSKMYCSSKGTALLFNSYEDAERFKNKYQGKGTVEYLDFNREPKYLTMNLYCNGQCHELPGYLMEHVVKDIPCYTLEFYGLK